MQPTTFFLSYPYLRNLVSPPLAMRLSRLGLLPRVLLGILFGVILGNFIDEGVARFFATINYIFNQFLSFMTPLIVLGLVAPAIMEIGKSAKKMVIVTCAMAYGDTIFASLIAFTVGYFLYPHIVGVGGGASLGDLGMQIPPYFTIDFPPLMDVLSALLAAFIVGLYTASNQGPAFRGFFTELKGAINGVIAKVIIPLLPLYIFGIFLCMTYTGEAYTIVRAFAPVVLVIFCLHIFVLLYEFLAAAIVTKRNPFVLLRHMLPAYFTALGTSSSSATIPVTLRQMMECGVSQGVSGFVAPLCAAIHMPGSAMKITSCALAICILWGMPHDPALFIHFVLLLGVMMIAAPGVPGATVMAAIALLQSVLGFGTEQTALIISLFVAMDSFGTACNVTSDGAIALIIDRFYGKGKKEAEGANGAAEAVPQAD